MRSDLGLLVCRLRALENFSVSNQMGEAVQQLCIDAVSRINVQLALELDRHGGHETKPYSVSGLFNLDLFHELTGRVQAGDTAWIQLCGLRADVVDALNRYFCIRKPEQVEINHHQWQLEHCEWVQHTTYHDLIEQAKSTPPPEFIAFEFITPASFRSKGVDMPLPTPRQLFTSIERSLRGLTGYKVPVEINSFLEYLVTIDEYQLQSAKRYLQDELQTGFLGHVQYRILPNNTNIRKDAEKGYQDAKELRDFLKKNANAHADLARALLLLRRFATYAGVGKKTTQGMGVIKLWDDKTPHSR